MSKQQITLAQLGAEEQNVIEPVKIEAHKTEVVTPKMASGATIAKEDSGEIAIVEDAGNILPRKVETPPEIINQEEIMKRLDDSLERNKRETFNEIILPAKDKIMALQLQKEMSGEDPLTALEKGVTQSGVTVSFKPEVHEESISEKINPEVDLNNLTAAKLDDSDFENLMAELKEEEEVTDNASKLSEEEEAEYKEWVEENQKKFQALVKSKINVSIPTQKLRISTASIPATKVLSNVATKVVNTASAPLIHSARVITLSALIGDEIPKLRAESYSSDLEAARGIYSIIYKHDVDRNKPENFDVWLKSICDWDIYQVYWALYSATFKDTNYLTYVCEECNNTFMVEKPIESMIRLDPDCTKGTKERVAEILAKGQLIGQSRLEGGEPTPISSQYAVSIKAPSLYNTTFETSALDTAFRKKYGQLVTIAQYIDNIYTIVNGTAVPLQTEVKDNATKSVKLKILTLSRIIDTLTVDEAARLTSLISSLMQYRNDDFMYFLPEVDCEGVYGPKKDEKGNILKGRKCTHHFDEQTTMESRNGRQVRISPLDLIFTREQLSALANFTIV